MPKVEIYTTPWCPYCHAAKSLLQEKGVDYTEVDVSDGDIRAAMIEKAHGRRTVPQIFIGETHVVMRRNQKTGAFSFQPVLDRFDFLRLNLLLRR